MLDAAASGQTLGQTLAEIVPLAAELCDLKRVRDARSGESLASRMFRAAWGALLAGQSVDEVARVATARAIAAARLGGIDAEVLSVAGLSATEATAVLARSFEEVAGPLDGALAVALRDSLGVALREGPPPAFAEALIRQPRAGATCPGKPRIMLEPPEGHGDHCFVVAVLAVVLAPRYGAAIGTAFLAGMAHHLHNAVLPDSGFAGEVLLGDHLTPILERLFARELATLPRGLRDETAAALKMIPDASTPVGRAFHAADVIDRVLQMRHYDDVARFTIDQALDDMDLVHAGPTQAFHHAVLLDAGLP
jgi:5'-deoxynucleotidase YfbR-like HD superfamily hydrolase